MAASWSTWQPAIFDAVKTALGSGVVVIWAYQGAEPMPPKPFCTLNLTSRDVGQGSLGTGAYDEAQPVGDVDGTWNYAHYRQHTLSLQVYSNTAIGDGHASAILAAVVRALRKEAVLQPLRVAGIKVTRAGSVQDLSALLDTRAESRASLDLTLATLDTDAEVIGTIATVETTIHATAAQGTVQ